MLLFTPFQFVFHTLLTEWLSPTCMNWIWACGNKRGRLYMSRMFDNMSHLVRSKSIFVTGLIAPPHCEQICHFLQKLYFLMLWLDGLMYEISNHSNYMSNNWKIIPINLYYWYMYVMILNIELHDIIHGKQIIGWFMHNLTTKNYNNILFLYIKQN